MKFTAIVSLAISLAALPAVQAGPLAYGLCQTGCNTVAVACYAAGGFVFGTVTAGVGTPLAILGCNAALGVCSATCAALIIAPTP